VSNLGLQGDSAKMFPPFFRHTHPDPNPKSKGLTLAQTIGSVRHYIYISILAVVPTYFINAYGQNPTSQKSMRIMGLPWVPELVRISNMVLGVGG